MIEVCKGTYRLEQSDYELLFSFDLLDIPDKFYAPYGFKLIKVNDENRWEPGTFED